MQVLLVLFASMSLLVAGQDAAPKIKKIMSTSGGVVIILPRHEGQTASIAWEDATGKV